MEKSRGMGRRCAHVFFDLDGTLIDPREGIVGCLQLENRVYEGVPCMLEALRASGRSLWVVTAEPTVYSATIVEHHGLRALFRNVHGSELTGERTDKGALIRHVLRTEGLSPRHTIMVGDRCHDVLGARTNGVASVGVRWGYGSVEELTTAGPDAIVASPSELIEYICRAGESSTPREDRS